MPADLRKIAQEAIELAEKATPGPWRGSMTGHSIKANRDFDEVLFAVPCNGRLSGDRWGEWLANVDLTCHAGTHYATIARALIEALDERDKLLAALPHALGSCGCVPLVQNRINVFGNDLWPEEHEAAIEWLRGRIE